MYVQYGEHSEKQEYAMFQCKQFAIKINTMGKFHFKMCGELTIDANNNKIKDFG